MILGTDISDGVETSVEGYYENGHFYVTNITEKEIKMSEANREIADFDTKAFVEPPVAREFWVTVCSDMFQHEVSSVPKEGYIHVREVLE